MESASWSLRLAFALAVASLIWAGAIALADGLVAGRAGHATPDAVMVPAGSGGISAR